MKKHCKNIDITSVEHCEQAVLIFLKGKTNRVKIARYFSHLTGWNTGEVLQALAERGERFYDMAHCAAVKLSQDIKSRSVRLRPINYRLKKDRSSLKLRKIGIQSVYQSMLDHVAVLAIRTGGMTASVGAWQCASIPGRGCVMGAKKIAAWLKNPKIKYAVKLDVSKCYQNIRPEMMVEFYRRHIGNRPLLWLLETLLANHKDGLSIGSFLSQWSCNLYLSQLWHHLAQEAATVKRGHRVRLFEHQLYYMDDVLLLGKNKRHLKKAAEMAQAYLQDVLRLSTKPWQVQKIGKRDFVDMMGFRCHRGFLTIRRRIYKRVRRVLIRASASMRHGWHMSASIARALMAFYGYISNSASVHIVAKYGVRWLTARASKLISQTTHHEKHHHPQQA